VDQKGNERRLIDVTPRKVVTAKDVVELVTKISVAVVEVGVEEEFGKGDNPDDRHTRGEE
jgi:hypothetical protein